MGTVDPLTCRGACLASASSRGWLVSKKALLRRPELFAGTLTEKLLTFALGRGVEYYDAPAVRQDSSRGPAGWLPLLVAHSGNRQERAVSDEEIVMIITKKALPRRTFLKGLQAALALPLLDAMIPAATALAQTPAKPVRRLGFVFVPMGCDHARWTPPGKGTLGELSPILEPLGAGQRAADGRHQPQAREILPGHARHVERGVPERGVRQTHRELGLFSRHHRRPGGGEADRPATRSCRRSSCRWT